jgi:tRNA-splicing ligase RtcB
MLHSGSRGTGNKIGRYFIEKAKKLMRAVVHQAAGQRPGLPARRHDEFNDYVEAVKWAQDYALENRQKMMEEVCGTCTTTSRSRSRSRTRRSTATTTTSSRRTTSGENLWVTRKGAIRAREGDLGIIPGSMGQRSYIVRGKGNPRATAAARTAPAADGPQGSAPTFTVADLVAQTEGVECRKDDACSTRSRARTRTSTR